MYLNFNPFYMLNPILEIAHLIFNNACYVLQYACRKAIADGRPRARGRFVKLKKFLKKKLKWEEWRTSFFIIAEKREHIAMVMLCRYFKLLNTRIFEEC
jgi:hypothetical protein